MCLTLFIGGEGLRRTNLNVSTVSRHEILVNEWSRLSDVADGRVHTTAATNLAADTTGDEITCTNE